MTISTKSWRRKLLLRFASTVFAFAGLMMAAVAQDTGKVDLAQLRKERVELDATVFASEVEAQRHEGTFVRLWDDMRAKDPFAVLAAVPLQSVSFAEPILLPSQDMGIEATIASLQPDDARPIKTYGLQEMREKLKKWQTEGWTIEQSEWHHSEFQPGTSAATATSRVSFEINASRAKNPERLIIRGILDVKWSGKNDSAGHPIIGSVLARDVTLLRQKTMPLFKEVIVADPKQLAPGNFPRASPIIAEDLDGDGKSEVIMAGCNVILRNKGNLGFEKADFLKHPIIRPAEAGILADFNGDAINDYIGADSGQGKLLYFKGESGGTFPNAPVIAFDVRLDNLHSLTAGDIDGDGDLDLFAGQWKPPYLDGVMPTPYWDANDGHPDYLLVNDGTGKFQDGTVAAGLVNKRKRRTFSSSFVDLDGDLDLDLLVVADFAGMDAYRNSGKGTFTDATDELLSARAGFGMSHAIADFNGDGNSDLYMVGMSSTTARRLDRLQVGRPGFEEYDRMRAPMAFGNRMLLQQVENGGGRSYFQPAIAETCARTGWSWGCTAADFDIDGNMDLFVSNGHLSGTSSKDYCTRFWCHDLYTGNSAPNKVIDGFFKNELLAKLGTEFSWNGFEHNVLFLNRAEQGFVNTAFLSGVAGEFDSRAALADDLNFDGRPDLLVVEYDAAAMSQKLHIYGNQLPIDQSNPRTWIGVRLYGGPDCPSPLGAVVTVHAGGKTFSRQMISGDSFTSQHAAAAVFGLGNTSKVDSLQVRWQNGLITKVPSPKINQYVGVRGVK